MKTIDAQTLIACGVQPTQAKVFASHIDAACKRFDISTQMQQAAFIAQAMHESMRFTHLEESLWYTKPENIQRAFARTRDMSLGDLAPYCKQPVKLANLVYANKNGNGDVSSGEGWLFRGSGAFQLTGRANFMAAGAAAGRDYKNHPEWVRENPEDAALTAGWFWSASHCNELMASGEYDKTTLRINGGTNGIVERRALYAQCMEALR